MAEETTEQSGKRTRTKDEILDEARKQRNMCVEAMSDNMNDARNDLLFLKGGTNQWDAEAVTVRQGAGLPIITVNTLPAFLHQVTNDQRMNTPSIKVHPVDDHADIETAKILQGMIKHIEYDSNADIAFDTAVNSAAAVGFGYFQLVTEYESPDSFNQSIKFKRIRNALSVLIDPLSSEPDGSDMRFAFIDSLMNKEDFKREYPKADANSAVPFSDTSGNVVTPWITKDTVMVCEYYLIEYVDDELVELSNGETGYKSKLLDLPEEITVVRSRPTQRSVVMWRKITSCDILEETEIKCDWIPVFPVYGDEIDIDGKVTRSGIIRNAKGPAQMYNVCMTGATEEVMLRAKSPYIMAEGQEEGHEPEWQMANRAPLAFLTYKPVALGDKLAPPPQRNPTADVPTGMLSLAMQSKENIMSTTGLFQASLGQKGTATSGKQEIAQQREGDMANFHYMDGLLRTQRHAGRCILSMIPHYYNTRRTVRILGDDESYERVMLNDPVEADGIQKVLNDMTIGKYDATVSSGPSFTTMRQESAEFFTNAMQAAKDPVTASVISYLAVKNQDVPNSELAAKLIESTLPPAMQQIIKEETGGEKGEDEQEPMVMLPDGPLPVSQVPQAIGALMQQVMQAQEAIKAADVAKQQAELLTQQNAQKELEIKAAAEDTRRREAEIKAFEAETDRMAAEAKAEIERTRAFMDGAKQETEAINAKANEIRAQMEASEPPEKQPEIPSISEIAQLIAASRSSPEGMTITAPSGGVYEVTMR